MNEVFIKPKAKSGQHANPLIRSGLVDYFNEA